MNHYPTEIQKFSQMASSWWDPNGPARPLHLINPVRMHFIQQTVSCQNQKILDVGCGAGLLTESLARAHGEVTGIDLSDDLIETALSHAHANQLSIQYHCTPVETFADTHMGHFDVVTCLELLEHVPEPDVLIQHCVKMTKPGGWVFFSTLDRTWQSFAMAILGAEYVLKWLPKGTHHYEHFIRPSELVNTLSQCGAVLRNLSGISLNPITKVAKLSPKIQCNYIAAFQKIKD